MNTPTNRRQTTRIGARSAEEVLPMWTPDKVICHRHTGDKALVVHVYGNCTIAVDLQDNSPLVTPKAILQREYSNWALFTQFDGDDWKYKKCTIRE